MYPIIVKREPQIVNLEKKVNLGSERVLTMADLIRHGLTENGSFEVIEEHGTQCVLYIYSKRLETLEEVAARVAKEEKYMENYTKFHANKAKK